MASRSLKVMVLFDLMEPPPAEQDYSDLKDVMDWEIESGVSRALKKLGHEVRYFGVFDDIEPLIHELQINRPDLVFNLCEAFRNDRKYEPNIVSLLELMGVSYTGCGPDALILCKDKGLTKKILNYHRIRIPRFLVSRKARPLKRVKGIRYPTFIKPLGLEASEGIAQMSFAENEKDCLDRVKFIHEKFKVDAIIEEYVDGRELYVGVLGNERLTVFPPRELFFNEVPEGEPKIATFKAKWDDAYRKKWGIRSGVAKGIEGALEKKITKICKKIYQLFQMKGYGRIDLRMKESGEIFFLEANPNPSIGISEDFALAAKKTGMTYEQVVEKIVNLSGV